LQPASVRSTCYIDPSFCPRGARFPSSSTHTFPASPGLDPADPPALVAITRVYWCLPRPDSARCVVTCLPCEKCSNARLSAGYLGVSSARGPPSGRLLWLTSPRISLCERAATPGFTRPVCDYTPIKSTPIRTRVQVVSLRSAVNELRRGITGLLNAFPTFSSASSISLPKAIE
jgi:hypothetical protein